MLNIAQARRERRLPAVLSRDEVKKIFSLVRPFHNYAYLATVYSCGLRLQERLYLEVADILDVIEFIRRFLQHVLPAGFMKVRHYGFMSSNCAVSLARLRLLILAGLEDMKLCLTDLSASKPKPPLPKPLCPACGGFLLYLFSLIPGRLCRGPT